MVTTNKKVNNYCKSDMTLPHKTRLHYTSIHQPDFLTLMTCSHIHTTYLTSLKVVSILSNEHIINCEYNVIFFYCDNANLHCLFFNPSVFTWCYDSSLIGYLFISGLQWFTLPPFYLKYFKIIEEGKQRKIIGSLQVVAHNFPTSPGHIIRQLLSHESHWAVEQCYLMAAYHASSVEVHVWTSILLYRAHSFLHWH